MVIFSGSPSSQNMHLKNNFRQKWRVFRFCVVVSLCLKSLKKSLYEIPYARKSNLTKRTSRKEKKTKTDNISTLLLTFYKLDQIAFNFINFSGVITFSISISTTFCFLFQSIHSSSSSSNSDPLSPLSLSKNYEKVFC